MVGEGSDVTAMDKQIRRFGMPMGPLELLDQVGLDVALHVASSLHGVLPGVGPVVDHLSALVDKGHLGKKSGLGFYQYEKGKRGKPSTLPLESSGAKPQEAGNDQFDDQLTATQRRLVYPMLTEAIRCYQERVVDEAWAIDLAMVLGTGFAPHLGGPLHVVDSIGPPQLIQNLNQMQSTLGDRFAPPKGLVELADRQGIIFWTMTKRCVIRIRRRRNQQPAELR